ncbi:EVE domain-containing protein [SAR202 cluster bacterium AC-647-N09_OGT_505m]|nr:EVE domain-containing protein [SAR202 cluster bacterium AC-647-N09_OGT_505m]
MPRGKTYWMVTSSLENFHITRGLDFTIQGMMLRQRRKAQRMEPGDRILYYITGVQRFGATVTVTSKCTEDHKQIWRSEGKADDFPWRVEIKADAVLGDNQFLDAREIGPRMEYVRRWPPEHWPLAFQGNLHILPKSDFELLEQEMKRVTSK